MLWLDNWTAVPLKDCWPHLFSFPKDENISVKKSLSLTNVAGLFHLPLSEEALTELYIDTYKLASQAKLKLTSTVRPFLLTINFRSAPLIPFHYLYR